RSLLCVSNRTVTHPLGGVIVVSSAMHTCATMKSCSAVLVGLLIEAVVLCDTSLNEIVTACAVPPRDSNPLATLVNINTAATAVTTMPCRPDGSSRFGRVVLIENDFVLIWRQIRLIRFTNVPQFLY